MGPHYFFGLTWIELGAILSILVILVTFFAWLMHIAVTKPMERITNDLGKSIDRLAKQVDGIGGNATVVHREHDKRLDAHDIHLARHDEEIKTLFSRTGNRGH